MYLTPCRIGELANTFSHRQPKYQAIVKPNSMNVASYLRRLVALFVCYGAAVLVIVDGQPTIDDIYNNDMSTSVLDNFGELVVSVGLYTRWAKKNSGPFLKVYNLYIMR